MIILSKIQTFLSVSTSVKLKQKLFWRKKNKPGTKLSIYLTVDVQCLNLRNLGLKHHDKRDPEELKAPR